MKKIKLTYKPDYDFVLIGISSHENDYKIAWSINNILNINLSKKKDITVFNKKYSETQSFSVFSHNDETRLVLYNLISNRCENGFLIQEFNMFDFFIQIYGEQSESYIKKLLNKLKKDNNIILAGKLDLSKIKSAGKLLF
ncbi:MAG: IPExxxVDY family protein [Bacteroidales bacterium]|nr:IPExxxVDY family protein [Bacteroidales bacterium]